MPKNLFPIVILISGNGSNFQAIIDAIKSKNLPIEIKAVISDQPDAYGLVRAQNANIKTEILNKKDFANREAFDQALLKCVQHYQPQLVVLAGYMKILAPAFVSYFQNRLINIHPALLPAYRGIDTHARVHAAKEKFHGTSVHLVINELDAGAIIAQAQLQIQKDDTPESLKTRVQAMEHELYPKVLAWFAAGRLRLLPQGIFWDGKLIDKQGLQFYETDCGLSDKPQSSANN